MKPAGVSQPSVGIVSYRRDYSTAVSEPAAGNVLDPTDSSRRCANPGRTEGTRYET